MFRGGVGYFIKNSDRKNVISGHYLRAYQVEACRPIEYSRSMTSSARSFTPPTILLGILRMRHAA
jgi:hypothetical protein